MKVDDFIVEEDRCGKSGRTRFRIQYERLDERNSRKRRKEKADVLEDDNEKRFFVANRRTRLRGRSVRHCPVFYESR